MQKKRLNKADIAAIAQEPMHIDTVQTEIAIMEVFKAIGGALAEGKEVSISGFGIFYPYAAKERKARNPQTGELVIVPAKSVPKFKPAKALKEQLMA